MREDGLKARQCQSAAPYVTVFIASRSAERTKGLLEGGIIAEPKDLLGNAPIPQGSFAHIVRMRAQAAAAMTLFMTSVTVEVEPEGEEEEKENKKKRKEMEGKQKERTSCFWLVGGRRVG